ncbi:serine/threonine-protein kinase [Catellatospora sp. NPDC049609]|uniref:serine/threonine-protein kinase n=1 Tax=Catellatospora sp. NPDC049609 TaxID=3155505 RepID=UPI00341DCED4
MNEQEWVVPGYTEIRELGRGASGTVVLAQHDTTGVQVAIKYLAVHLRGDETFIRAFRAEARVMSEVDSPQVARLYEYVEAPGGAAIVMELVDGVALRAILREQGPTEPEAALVVLKGSLLGLAAAHERGVVHRDYKPENVLVNGEGQSKLADFGIAARSGRQGPLAGTPSYMAPEQWAGAPASPSTDIYAATATFFECLVGQPPYRAPGDLQGLRLQHEQAPIPADLVPEAIRGLVRRGLAKDAKQRPKDATTFLRELEAVAGAGYGPEWEEEGRSKLARRALLLALLFPLAAVQANATAVGTTILGLSRKAFTVLAATTITLVLILGGVGAAALWPEPASLPTPLPSATADVSPTAEASPSPSLSPSPSPSPSESPSPSPSPSDDPQPSPSKKPSPKPSPSPSPSPTPTISVLVLNLDRQTICALKACTQYIAAGATFRASGTGTARLYIQFFQSNDGKNQGGSAANATSKEFTIPSDSPYNYSTSMPISQACARDANGAYYYSIVKAWMVVGGRTVMSDTKSIYCGIIVE